MASDFDRPGVECDPTTGRVVNTFCPLCSTDNTVLFLYMVHNELWDQVSPYPGRHSGVLCIRCFVKKLGRPLASSDLPDCRLNALLKEVLPKMPRLRWSRDLSSNTEHTLALHASGASWRATIEHLADGQARLSVSSSPRKRIYQDSHVAKVAARRWYREWWYNVGTTQSKESTRG